MFVEDQETDRLIDLRQYVDVYDSFEKEVAEMVNKYKQQEQMIMSLKQENLNLIYKIEQHEFFNAKSTTN
jgi:hypothetical protein